MARKYGINNKMSTHFADYDYIINGVGGIGKTTMVYEIGKKITGSDEGTFVINFGEEPKPDHIDGIFYDKANTFADFRAIVKELCINRAEYSNTKFIAFDSLDEMFRITENYVVAEYNNTLTGADAIKKKAKSIKQAYGGYQAGENKVVTFVCNEMGKLRNAGYHILAIGHTKIKERTDISTKVRFEQLTCNLDNKYYNAIKDKVALVAMCYYENEIINIETKTDAYTKKTKEVGQVVNKKRVMVFQDNENAVDTKTHFKNITPKIDFGIDNFIKAVEDAIQLDLQGVEPPPAIKVIPIEEENTEEETTMEDDDIVIVDDDDEVIIADDDEAPVEEEKPVEIDTNALMAEIRKKFKTANEDIKAKIKTYLDEHTTNGKLSNKLSAEELTAINNMLK